MLLKIVAIFLIFIVVMGAVQKLLLGRKTQGSAMDRLRCPRCKRIQIASTAGPCGRPDCTPR